MKLTIRRSKQRGQLRFILDYTPLNGARKRLFFRTKQDAEKAAEEKRLESRKVGESFLSLSAAERLDLMTGYDRLRELNVSLAEVIRHWETGAARNGNGNGHAPAEAITLERAGQEWEKFLRRKGNSEIHCSACGRWARQFAKGREQQPVREITTKDVLDYLDQYDGVTFNSKRDSARSFFSFCHSSGWMAEFVADSKRIPKRKIERPGAIIFTVDQVRRALQFCRDQAPELLGYFVVSTFAGCRPTEVDRMRWDDIDLEHGLIHIRAETSKTRRTRLVNLHPTAVAWLQLARQSGAEFNLPQKQAQLVPLRNHLGFAEWPMDIMRHSFGSYHVARDRNVGDTALQMGNSPQIVLAHYFNVVKPQDCAAFWALTPDTL